VQRAHTIRIIVIAFGFSVFEAWACWNRYGVDRATQGSFWRWCPFETALNMIALVPLALLASYLGTQHDRRETSQLSPRPDGLSTAKQWKVAILAVVVVVGLVGVYQMQFDRMQAAWHDCETCSGSGVVGQALCPQCKGVGGWSSAYDATELTPQADRLRWDEFERSAR